MSDREKVDLTTGDWNTWIVQVCAALGVDPTWVDVPLIHDLTKQVAHRYERPMAPVSAFIVGVALGRSNVTPAQDVTEALARLVEQVDATLPPES